MEWIGPAIVVTILSVFVGPMLARIVRNSRMKKEVMQRGVDGTATILSNWDTGVRINNKPQVGMTLLVRGTNGEEFEADATETVSIVHLPMFQPGATLRVKYDPFNTSRVAIVGLAQNQIEGPSIVRGDPSGDPAQITRMIEAFQKRNQEIETNGLLAPATVLQFTPMGVMVNGNNPAVNLLVEVRPDSAPQFVAQAHGIVIAEGSIPKFQPGERITVRYDPNDLTRVAVERSGVT